VDPSRLNGRFPPVVLKKAAVATAAQDWLAIPTWDAMTGRDEAMKCTEIARYEQTPTFSTQSTEAVIG